LFRITAGDTKAIINRLLSLEQLLGVFGSMFPDDRLAYTSLAKTN
jgi:hypothetical protein